MTSETTHAIGNLAWKTVVLCFLVSTLWFAMETHFSLHSDQTLAKQWRTQAEETKAENAQLYRELDAVSQERARLDEELYRVKLQLVHTRQMRWF